MTRSEGWMMVIAVIRKSWPLDFRSSFSTKRVSKFFEWIEFEKILKWVISTKNIPQYLVRVLEHKVVRMMMMTIESHSYEITRNIMISKLLCESISLVSCSWVVKIIRPLIVEILVGLPGFGSPWV